ncbi:hypothetical protein B0T20DRAFT_510220 [Sordaria brevicollis]|uniref:Uncharacterized protein n=1 Tax=Sordaria brevicollis TaxID=83679 RepID=A0AAE0U5X9_SORBR|nr:hypothetical protein B0T20DRAFT_510220 [Sordaria brevicollis]
MCIRVLTIFKCACPHRNTLVCPHHVHVLDPSSTTTTSDLSSKPSSRPPTSSSSSDTPSSSPRESPTSSSETPSSSPSQSPSDSPEITTEDSDDFQKGFTPRLPSALQGHKLWTPLPGKENQRWEHCPGYLAKSRALQLATSTSNSKSTSGGGSGDVTTVGKETQCAEYKATDPKYRRRWEVKTGLCESCRGVHGMDGPGVAEEQKVVAEKVVRIDVGRVVKGKGVVQEERGRARSRAVTDPTIGIRAVPVSARVPVPVDGGSNTVKGVSGKAVGKRVVRKRIATL